MEQVANTPRKKRKKNRRLYRKKLRVFNVEPKILGAHNTLTFSVILTMHKKTMRYARVACGKRGFSENHVYDFNIL